jgi:primosomal protein N' (replication factor Y)
MNGEKALSQEESPFCLRIAVPLPVRGTFSYTLPAKLVSRVQVGCRASVPFNNREITGYILEKHERREDRDLREVSAVLDTEPLFHENIVPFFEWVAEYYVCPLGQVIQSALPGGLNMTPYKSARLTQEGVKMLKSLPPDSEAGQTLSWVDANSNKRLVRPYPKLDGLEKKGWLVVEERRGKRRAGPLLRKFVRLKAGTDPSFLSREDVSSRARNEEAFLEMVFRSGPRLLSELSAAFPNGGYLAQKWIRRGLLETYTEPVCRNPVGEILFPSPKPQTLYDQQGQALDTIRRSLDRRVFSSYLLHGVTGSGKTEVYYGAVEHVIRSGRTAILMVPEIGLASYIEGLFRSRLGERIAVYHSGLSEGERYDQWMRMVRGEVDVVIGARSALFSPLPALGLIIVDEEHDSAYKQDANPRYQGRDAAVLRARLEKAVVVLGSGTPAVQSYQNCLEGRYELLSMPHRIEKRPLPEVEVVDMKALEEDQEKGKIISPKLREAIDRNLKKGNQAILFLNRRGFHRIHLCRSCGQSIRCPNCDVALTYHLKEDRLGCHYCGFHCETPVNCPSCGREGLRTYGFGTEKLVHELKSDFPTARVARLDKDSTRKKGSAFQILKRFSERETDILVGTQMITKGYDFPMVTLVGVIAADLSLSFPDFRAGERTYQILSQVAGRAGRGDQPGRVIIQTFNPEHYAILGSTTHDYRAFFEREKDLRAQLSYPPFSHLACLGLKGNDKVKTSQKAQDLCNGMRNILSKWPKRGKEIQVLGPAEAPISRLKGKHRWQILVKCGSASLLNHFLTRVEAMSRAALKSSGVHLTLDVDPYQMI